MRFRLDLWVLLAIIGCVGKDDDGSDTPPSSLDADADADTDADADADADTDTDTTTDDTVPVLPSLVGNTYFFALNSSTIVQPAGAGPLFSSQWSTPFLISVTGQSGTTLDLRLANSLGSPVQAMCVETVELLGVDAGGYPAVAYGPADHQIPLASVPIDIESLSLEFTFDATADRLGQSRVTGQAETSPLSESILGVSDPGEFCTLLVNFGISCVPCASGSSNYCMNYEATGAQADRVPGLTLVQRTAADIAADPGCQ